MPGSPGLLVDCCDPTMAPPTENPPITTNQDPDWIVHSADPAWNSLPVVIRQTADGFWQSRALAWRLFIRNLRGEYRQSLLGWLWIFLPALANAGVWVLLNSSGTVRISQLSGMQYAAFVYVGTVLWQAFTDGLIAPMNTLQANRSPLTKLPFPKEVFVLVSLMETGFDLVARILVAVLLLGLGGAFHPLGLGMMMLLWGPALVLLGLGGGLILAPFGLLYKDVSKSLTMLLPVWMLLTPVIYPMPAGTGGQLVAWINPPAAMVHLGRDAVMPVNLSEAEAEENKTDANPDRQAATRTSAGTSGQKPDSNPADSNPAGPDPDSPDPDSPVDPVTTESQPSAPATRSPSPASSLLAPACFWAVTGVLVALAGTVWLRITSPIVIERLAN